MPFRTYILHAKLGLISGAWVSSDLLEAQCRLSDAKQPQPRGAARGALDRVLVDFGLKHRTTLLVATYLAVPAALAGSDLVATVPRRVAELIAATARVAVTPLPIDFALTVSMAWHRRAATDPAQSWFRSLLIEAAAA